MDERLKQSKDLGETMVIAHAVIAAEAGADVVVLIDDGRGAQVATRESQRLHRLRRTGGSAGSITLASTVTVLAKAAGTQHIRDKGEMREIYRRLRVSTTACRLGCCRGRQGRVPAAILVITACRTPSQLFRGPVAWRVGYGATLPLVSDSATRTCGASKSRPPSSIVHREF